MPVARQTAIQRRSQATTEGDFGGQNETRAIGTRTKQNTANILINTAPYSAYTVSSGASVGLSNSSL